MDREGLFEPETREATRDRFEAIAPAARTVVRESARQMGFDREEFDERLTDEVVAAAHEALFASLLVVRVGTRGEYEAWRDEREFQAVEVGNENVDRVAWHAAPFANRLVAATFHGERAAAVGTLRRQAFGRLYREVVQ